MSTKFSESSSDGTSGVSNPLNKADVSAFLRWYNRLKFFLIWLLMPIIALLLLSYVLLSYADHAHNTYSAPVRDPVFSNLYTNSDGSKIIILTESLKSPKSDTSFLLVSHDSGKNFEEIKFPYWILALSMNWEKGEGIAVVKQGVSENHIVRIEQFGRKANLLRTGLSTQGKEYYNVDLDWATGRGVVCGSENLYTSNFGETWKTIEVNGLNKNFYGVRICMDWNKNRGFIADGNLGMISTNDFKYWKYENPKSGFTTQYQILDVQMNWKRNSGVASGYNYEKAAATMQMQSSILEQSSILPKPVDMQPASASDYFITEDGGNTWVRHDVPKIRSSQYPSFYNVASMFDSGEIILAGSAGEIMLLNNQSLTSYSIKDTTVTINRLCNLPDSSALCVGFKMPLTEGVLFQKRKGSEWEQVPVVRVVKSEWLADALRTTAYLIAFCGALMVILIVIMQGLHERVNLIQSRKRKESALALMSDNPTDTDTLGIFTSTVAAISQLIKNPDSKPPITIALSGDWGTGKSSLMSQIRKELSGDERFMTLWFNVWHFQSEQHLLATFFTSLMSKMNRHISFRYRFRLWYNKLHALDTVGKIRFYLGSLIVFPPILYLILLLDPINSIVHDPLYLIPPLKYCFDGMEAVFTMILDGPSMGKALSAIVYLAGILLVRKEWLPSGLGAFFELIPFHKFKLEMKGEDPGIREKYKKEFWEIMRAAGNEKRYVVFLDDVDRIDGNKIKELLETINFITDTASRPPEWDNVQSNMFFIMSMSMNPVLENLGAVLNDIGEVKDNREKGAHYIEKMVDLVVEVPDFNYEGVTTKINNLTMRS